MSYTSREQSEYAGQPLMLFRFSLGESQWLFTSADHAVVMGEDEYQPAYIRGGRIVRCGDARKSTLEIEVAASNPVALVFLPGWIGGLMLVTVYRHHHEDSEFSVQWKGRVVSCKWAGSTATLACDSAFTLFRRAGLRRNYQPGCPHVLFGPGCGVNTALHRVATTVTAVSGNALTMGGLGAYPAGYFTGGMIKFGGDYRLITAHSGAAITTLDGVPNLSTGSAVELWPGCARDMGTCHSKFNNLDNFGGLPFLPRKNPFSGDALV